MEEIKKSGSDFPFVPSLYFVKNIGTEAWTFLKIFAGLVLLSTLYLFFNWTFPMFWLEQTQAVADPTLLPVQIAKIDFLGFQIPMNAEALQSWITYIGNPILANTTIVFIWIFFSIIGWAGLLAATSRFQAIYFYTVWILFAIWIYFTDASSSIFNADPYRLASFTLILLFLAPAYYLKNLPAPPSIIRLTGFFSLLLSFFWMLIYYRAGYPGLFLGAARPFPVFFILTLAGMLFWAKEFIHFLVLITTNHESKQNRKSAGFFVVVNLILIIISGLYAAQAAKYIEFKLPLSPMLFYGLSIIISIVTSQAIYGYIKHQIQSNFAFCLALLSIGLLSLQFLSFIGASGETIFMRQAERYWSFLWFFANLGQFFYFYGNFTGYFKERVNFYYLIYEAEKFGYFAIPILSAGMLFLWESNTRWVSINYLSSIYGNIRGDYHLLMDNKTEAIDYYGEAVSFTQGNFKANYNYACLMSEKFENQIDAINYFKQSELIEKFPAARLNAAMLYISRRKPELAIQALSLAPYKDFSILNNLGILYYQAGLKDSSFKYLNLAWKENPSSETALNMCKFYNTFNQKDSVFYYLTQAKSLGLTDPAWDAALFYNLAYDSTLVDLAPHSEDYALTMVYNNLINHWKQKKYKEADQMANFLKDDKNEKPSILQAKMLTQWGLDSIENAISRTVYLSGMHPEYRIQANRILGALLWEKRCPELAAVFFKEAGVFGSDQDSLLYCLAAASAGLYDEASFGLEKYISNHAIALDTVAPALKLLNQLKKGELTEPIQNLKEAQMAIAFCGNLRTQSAKNIWNQFNNDPMIQLTAAEIAIDSKDLNWQKEILKKLSDNKKFDRVKAWMSDVSINLSSENQAYLVFEARKFMSEKKYKEAISSIKKYLKTNPLDAQAAMLLADLHLLNNDPPSAILSFGDYMRLNDQSRLFIANMLNISEKLGNETEVIIAATRLFPLLSTQAEKDQFLKKYPQIKTNNQDQVVNISNN